MDICPFHYVGRTTHLVRQAKRHASRLFIICLFISFVFHTQPDQAVIGEEMLATAALFVKLDSAKNLPVSVQCCLSFPLLDTKECKTSASQATTSEILMLIITFSLGNKCCPWHHKCILQTYCWKHHFPEQGRSNVWLIIQRLLFFCILLLNCFKSMGQRG